MLVKLSVNSHLKLISVYAPTMTYQEEDKEQFYQIVRNILQLVPRKDKLLLLGDFNACTGTNLVAWPNVMDPYSLGHQKANGRTPTALPLLRRGSHHHQHPLQATRHSQDHMDAPMVRPLVLHRLSSQGVMTSGTPSRMS